MERFTMWLNGKGAGLPGKDCFTKLAKYEDTGLEPESILQLKKIPEIFNCSASDQAQLKQIFTKIQNWADAEGEGRLVVLPCKMGDTVWTNRSVVGDYLRDKNRPYPCNVVFIGISDAPFIHAVLPNERVLPFDFEDFGKTVFLTREEAEAALGGKQS